MDKKDMNPELLKTLMAIQRNSKDQRPYIMKVNSARVQMHGNTETTDLEMTYELCSACYSQINHTWDHCDWCELFKAEPLSDWLEKGKNEK